MEIFIPSPAFVDLVVNHESVRATIDRGDHKLASADIVRNPDNAVYGFDGGVALFVQRVPDVYVGHIAVLSGSRGSEALRFGRAALHRLFTERRASKLVAHVPIQLSPARYYCRRLGLKSESRDLFEETFTMERELWAVS